MTDHGDDLRVTMGVDAHGQEVLRFQHAAREVGRLGLLEDLIMKMFESGAWRHYHTAIGEERWRACEFDYFLISSDITYADAQRVYAWKDRGRALAAATMSDDPRKRRSLADVSAWWPSPGPEPFTERAERLGWTHTRGLRGVPASRRAKVYVRHGVDADTHERAGRRRRVGDRRTRLDSLVASVIRHVRNETELRYVIDELRKGVGRTQQRARRSQHEQWARDITELNGNAQALAKRWAVSLDGAYKRIRRLQTPAT